MLGSKAVVESLKSESVQYVAGVPGDGVVEILDSMYDDADIKFILVRHEQAAVHISHAYSRIMRAPKCVCLTSRGAGAANTSMGLVSALHCGSPVVSISTQVNSKTIGRFAFEEIDLAEFFRPITKWSAEVNTPERIPEFINDAFRHAMAGSPGPVHLAIPSDYLRANIEARIRSPAKYRAKSDSRPPQDAIHTAAEILSSSSSPIIIAGEGILWGNAYLNTIKLAELLGSPVVCAWFRKDVFPENHPLSAGMMGLGGVDLSRDTIKQADAVLIIGCELSDLSTDRYKMRFPPNSKVIQIDIEPQVVGKIFDVDVPIIADAGEATHDLIELLQNKQSITKSFHDLPNVQRFLQNKETWLGQLNDINLNGSPIEPAIAVKELRNFLKDDAIITIDSGNFCYWSVAYYMSRQPSTYISGGGYMGYALPGAIGAKLA
ncbi:MAG: thiamine pyrophosphate-binding protein, partial [Nitrososphaerales archaeon]